MILPTGPGRIWFYYIMLVSTLPRSPDAQTVKGNRLVLPIICSVIGFMDAKTLVPFSTQTLHDFLILTPPAPYCTPTL